MKEEILKRLKERFGVLRFRGVANSAIADFILEERNQAKQETWDKAMDKLRLTTKTLFATHDGLYIEFSKAMDALKEAKEKDI